MHIDQYSLFFIIALVAAGLSIFLSLSVLPRKHSPGARPFSLMMASIFVWNISIAFGMLADNSQSALVWISIRMIPLALTPVLWWLFTAGYLGRENFLSREAVLLSLLIPAVTWVIFLTNARHGLFYTGVELIEHGPFLVESNWQFGPYFYIHLIYSLGLVLAGDLLLLREAIRLSNRYKRQAAAMVVATIFPLLITLVQVFQLIPGLQVNIDPIAFTITGLILGWTIYRNELFDLSPIARGILVDHMVDGMIVVNQQNRIVDLNPAAEKIFSINDNVVGADLDDLFEDLRLEPLETGGDDDRHHIKMDTRDGVRHFYDIQTSQVVGNRALRGTLITIRDITSQKRIEDQLQYLAITDSLTGLANHRHFYELLNNELERSKRSYEPFSVIMLDIDHFKRINDNHGHLIGDQVLREISILCMKALRQYDILCRYGGEEFSVILPETDIWSAKATAERLRKNVESNTFLIADTEFNLTISLGVSCYDPYNPVAAKELVGQADRRLYISKENGRNQVTVSNPEQTN